jgi:UDP-GlcNAc3NAcA epimerase
MIITVIGARPQFVKAAVVSKALKEAGLEEIIVHTGQHYDDKMSSVFWDELNIPPYSINLNVGSGMQGEQTAKIIEKLEKYLLCLPALPKCIILYGDTNSTLAGSLVAAKLNIPIVHIESGLRSFNRTMPEEINRIVTDHLSQILFCSSEQNVDQLKKEGITDGVYLSGDVMFDAVLQFGNIAETKIFFEDVVQYKKGEYCLFTLHRPSNTNNIDNIEKILSGIGKINLPVLWPLHPRVKHSLNGIIIPDNITIVPPYSYFQMLLVLKYCHKVFTDSGGLQKEAYWLKKQCITFRNETEWTETLHNNWNVVCGTDVECFLNNYNKNTQIDTWSPLYGAGDASIKIVSVIKEYFYQ